MWQDILISVVNIIFVFALFSQVYYGFKKKKGLIILRTSFLNALGLFTISIAFLTIPLYFSAIFTALNAIFWAILFFQRIVYQKV